LILPITNVDVIGDVIGDVMWSRNRLYILLFAIKLSNEDIAEIESLRDVAMEANFGTTLAANGLWHDAFV